MRIGISADGESLKDTISEVFARCSYFIIIELENGKVKSFKAVKNEARDRMGGVGILAAQLIAEENVKAVITKNIGPRAFDVLRQFNIEVYQGEGKIEKAIKEFIQGKLERFE